MSSKNPRDCSHRQVSLVSFAIIASMPFLGGCSDNDSQTSNRPSGVTTEFLASINSGQTEKVKAFLDDGHNANDPGLVLATLYCPDPTMAHILARRGNKHFAEIELAAVKGDVATVKQLVGSGVSVDRGLDPGGVFSNTPLMIAAHHGHDVLVEWLVEHGANLEANNRYLGTRGPDQVVAKSAVKSAFQTLYLIHVSRYVGFRPVFAYSKSGVLRGKCNTPAQDQLEVANCGPESGIVTSPIGGGCHGPDNDSCNGVQSKASSRDTGRCDRLSASKRRLRASSSVD